MVATHKTVSTNQPEQGSCHTGVQKRWVRNNLLLTHLFHAILLRNRGEKSLILCVFSNAVLQGAGCYHLFPQKCLSTA